MSENNADKPHEPTQKKLDDAREKGEIARSNDLWTASAYVGLLLAGGTVGVSLLDPMAQDLKGLLAQADKIGGQIAKGPITPLFGEISLSLATKVWPWFLFPAVVVVLALFAMRSVLFTPSKLAPKLSRISPLSGFKNKFGRQGFFEFGKSFAKMMVYLGVLGVLAVSQFDQILGATSLESRQILLLIRDLLLRLLFVVCVIALTVGAFDFLWQNAQHLRKNRMDHQDLKEEFKNAEGDPALKQKRRQRAQEIASNGMMAAVPTADVVVVNPTHYAVALKWDSSSTSAPVCVAKGVDEVALSIRQIALENKVPIHADPPNARALFATVALGQTIRPEHYEAVAVAIRFAHGLKTKARPI